MRRLQLALRVALCVGLSAAAQETHAATAGECEPELRLDVAVVNDSSTFAFYGVQTEARAQALLQSVDEMFADGVLQPTIHVNVVSMVTIIGANPWPETSVNGELDTTALLADFGAWARANLAQDYDAVVLLSRSDFEGTTIGDAVPASIGTPLPVGVVQANHLAIFDASSIAHELGRILGLSEGTSDPACLGSIMDVVANPADPAVSFSACSAAELAALYASDPDWKAALLVPPGADCDGSPTTDAALAAAQEAVDRLASGSLKSSNNATALHNKLDAVGDLIAEGLFAEALAKLEADILAKTNGCAVGGTPDRNDWVLSCDEQAALYQAVLDLIDSIRNDPNNPATETDCGDGIDNDGDDALDCADSDCVGAVLDIDRGSCVYGGPCSVTGSREEVTTWCGESGPYTTGVTISDASCDRPLDTDWRGQTRTSGPCTAIAGGAPCSYAGSQLIEQEACDAIDAIGWVSAGLADCSLDGTTGDPDLAACAGDDLVTGTVDDGLCWNETCCALQTTTLDVSDMAYVAGTVDGSGTITWTTMSPVDPASMDDVTVGVDTSTGEAIGTVVRFDAPPSGAEVFLARTPFTWPCVGATGDWTTSYAFEGQHVTCSGTSWSLAGGATGCSADDALPSRGYFAPGPPSSCDVTLTQALVGPFAITESFRIEDIAGPSAGGMAFVPVAPVTSSGFARFNVGSLELLYFDTATCGGP